MSSLNVRGQEHPNQSHPGFDANQFQTPNLDRLVRRGVAFERADMQGGLNAATCVPSRAMLLPARPPPVTSGTAIAVANER